MFARVSRFEGINEPTPEVAAAVEERVMPILEGMTGWLGGMQLVDRAGAKVLTVSFFDTLENLQAAEPTFEEMPQRLGDLRDRMGGERTSVERYEVLGQRFPSS